MTAYNNYTSIIPSELGKNELVHICTELQTAKNWKLDKARINIVGTGLYDLDVDRLVDYQNELKNRK